MCHCILNGVKPLCDERVAAESTAIAGAAYLSQLRGRAPVRLDDLKAFAREKEKQYGDEASDVLLDELSKGVAR